jgi:hypothetical protein
VRGRGCEEWGEGVCVTEIFRYLQSTSPQSNRPCCPCCLRRRRRPHRYANRAGNRWVEDQQLDTPIVHNVQGYATMLNAGGGQASVFRDGVCQLLREGAVCLQIRMGDDYVQTAGGAVSLFRIDPWDLISSVLPSKVGVWWWGEGGLGFEGRGGP